MLVQVENAEKVYRSGAAPVHALKGVSLTLEAGRFHALMGRSGSGKTTLLNLIGGLDRPSAGRVLFQGRDLAALSDAALTRWRRRQVGFIFQSVALLPTLSAFENAALPLMIAGWAPAERDRRAREALELVGLGKRMHHRPFELSGGEQQRVAIARALAPRPALLLADEPTGELDSQTGMAILVLFRHLVQAQGVTLCMASHDPAVQEMADQTHHLADGRLVQTASQRGSR